MKLDLKPLLRGEITSMTVDLTVPAEAPADVIFTGEAHLTGEIVNQGGYMRMTAEIAVPYEGTCARCLTPVKDVFRLPFERTVVTETMLSEEEKEENVDEYIILSNGILDADEPVREAILLSFPMRLLCEENCPGLCPKCGKPLREGKCDCPDHDPDPRWDVLRNWHE